MLSREHPPPDSFDHPSLSKVIPVLVTQVSDVAPQGCTTALSLLSVGVCEIVRPGLASAQFVVESAVSCDASLIPAAEQLHGEVRSPTSPPNL